MRRPVRILRGLVPVALAATLALTGCGSGGAADPGSAKSPSGSGAYPVTVHGDAGAVTVDRRPTSIVSLSPTVTEMLYSIGAGKQVKAVDDQSDHPARAPRTKLSGFKPNVEAIAGYRPDLVVLSYESGDVVDGLQKLKIPVYVADAAKNLHDSYQQIDDLGKLTGHADGARRTVRGMRQGIAKAEQGLPKSGSPLTYYYELDPQLHTLTSKTFVGALFASLGLRNVADKADKDGTGYPQLSKEYLVKSDPDLIFLADTKCCSQSAKSASGRPGWDTMSAVDHHEVYQLDDDIASRWGPRVVQLVRQAAAAVKSARAS